MGPPYKQNENFTCEVLGIKIGLKGGVEFISEKKIFKNDFGFKILEKGNILRPFSDIAPSKMKITFLRLPLQALVPS